MMLLACRCEYNGILRTEKELNKVLLFFSFLNPAISCSDEINSVQANYQDETKRIVFGRG